MSVVLSFFFAALTLYLFTMFLAWLDDRPNKECFCGYRDDATRKHQPDRCQPWSEVL